VAHGGLEHRDGGLLLGDLSVHLSGLGAQTLSLHVLLLHLLPVALALGVQGVQAGAGLVPRGLGGVEIRLQLAGARFQLVQILEPHGDFQHPHLIPQDKILLRLLRLVPQRFHLQFELRDLVVDAHQVLLRALQLVLGLLLAVAELGNAGRLLENLAALAAAGGEDLVDLALSDDGVALPAHAGVQKQLGHVPQADRLAIDVIFALSAAVIPAGHGHLRLLHGGENVAGVVQNQRHLRESQLGPLGGAAEDHVLHLRAPESLGALFAHDPADGVGNIGFSASVRTDNGGDILPEVQNGLIRKRLESLDFQCF